MMNEHVLSEDLVDAAARAFANHAYWVAYNTNNYFLGTEDVWFFKTQEDAREFAGNNLSDYDTFSVVNVHSVEDLLRVISRGETMESALLTIKTASMTNERNFEYLSSQIKYTGFGEELQAQLKEIMEKQEPQFMLTHRKDYGMDETTATLHFRKSDETDMYFFNRYTLVLKNEKHPDAIKQTFYVNPKEDNITLKEAYNLMSGRAIAKEMTTKEGEKYNAWLQINFKETEANGNFKLRQFHENYGYDLRAVLSSYPINELASEQQKQRLIESLERGNRQLVTMNLGGSDVMIHIEANPQFKTLNLYDADMKRVMRHSLSEKAGAGESQTNSQRQAEKMSVVNEQEPPELPKKGKRKKQTIN